MAFGDSPSTVQPIEWQVPKTLFRVPAKVFAIDFSSNCLATFFTVSRVRFPE